ASWTKLVQTEIFTQNHPLNCETVPILLCSTQVNKFQGTGSRLFFLGRCIAEGLNSDRAIILSNDLPSTHDILAPFEPWSNCSAKHAKVNVGRSRVKVYYPMASNSLQKSSGMPAVGALYPKKFSDKGYWWWKAQEIKYALRPKKQTTDVFESKYLHGHEKFAVFQIRRTDKSDGCEKTYGDPFGIKCKKEANAPALSDFVDALRHFQTYDTGNFYRIHIVTDDANIRSEIQQILNVSYKFMRPEPAPRRLPDKDRKGGVYKTRALKDATDIMLMAHGNPLIFTYSSGFGALALQLKQVRENFCSNWASLDWGKREWPPIGTIGKGGLRGVKLNSEVTSRLCEICTKYNDSSCLKSTDSYCSVILKRSVKVSGAAIVSLCGCN
ncbi:unnamed protein product, partial [Bathycoccus prasinos]